MRTPPVEATVNQDSNDPVGVSATPQQPVEDQLDEALRVASSQVPPIPVGDARGSGEQDLTPGVAAAT